MTSVTDILHYAYNKDAVNLMPAIDAVMTNKIQDQIENQRSTIASSVFGEPQQLEAEEETPEPSNSDEGLDTDDEVA